MVMKPSCSTGPYLSRQFRLKLMHSIFQLPISGHTRPKAQVTFVDGIEATKYLKAKEVENRELNQILGPDSHCYCVSERSIES